MIATADVRERQDVMTDADFNAWHERWKKATAKNSASSDETTIDEANAQELAAFDAAEASAINARRAS